MLLDVLRSTRIPITLLVGAATLAGYVLQGGIVDRDMLTVTVGALLLASGCSILNQIQERHLDGRMERTRHRPIASGRLSPRTAMGIVVVLIISALAVFHSLDHNQVLFGLTLLTIALYNGIYTPLKRRTPFALLIGAVMGAFPPLFGWAAGGGSLMDSEIIILAVVFYLWQIPHFWLLVDRYRDDYLNAGFPQLCQSMPENRYRRLVFLWVLAYLVSILLIPLFLPMQPATRNILALLPVFSVLIGIRYRRRPTALFALINISILVIIAILVTDRTML